jgi:hypothetical protein
MSRVDVNTFVGGYAFRHLPHPEAAVLVRVLEREGVDGAWVGHLPSVHYRDPEPGNEELLTWLAPFSAVLRAAPTLRPDWPGWESRFARLLDADAVAIRAYPTQWGMAAQHVAMRRLAGACGEAGIPLLLSVRLEDLRQRHWMDTAPDLSGAAIRDIVRADARVRVVVTGAGRSLIEEVHWGLTQEERGRLWWDISWIWGPPEDDLAHLLGSLGSDRFVYGSGWPLRLTQTPVANLELLPAELQSLSLGDALVIGRSRAIG